MPSPIQYHLGHDPTDVSGACRNRRSRVSGGALGPNPNGPAPSAGRSESAAAQAADSRRHQDVRSLEKLNDTLLEEVEHFFVSYNEVKGKQFKPLKRSGPARAREIIEEAMKTFSRRQRRGGTKSKSTKTSSGTKKRGR